MSESTALHVEPMNDRLIEWPLVSPNSLSEDAQFLYHSTRGGKLDRDIFDSKMRNRYVSPAEEKAFNPTDRMMAAIQELEAARLGSYSSKYGHNLSLTKVHEHYTVAFGRGSQFIRVNTYTQHQDESELLAVLIGGDLENRGGSSNRPPEIIVRSRHENATDFEHDTSSTAHLVINFPTAPEFSGYGGMEFQGVLTSANLYPLGADPLVQSDSDTKYDGEHCEECKDHHPFAPYLPPAATWLSNPTFVKVEVLPLRPYRVSAS